jgi:hypothetical protein
VHVGALRPRDERHEQADGAGTEHQESRARRHRRALDAAQGIAAGLDQRAELGADGVRQRHERGLRHRQALGDRARPAVADADLEAVVAEVLASTATARADAAAEHGVAGDAPAQPRGVDTVADHRDRAAPLVADAQRVGRVSGVQVGHRAEEELGVGAAHPHALDVDDHLTRSGLRIVDVLHLPASGAGDDEGSHQRGASTCCCCVPRPSMPSDMTSPGASQIGGVKPMPTPGGVPVLIRSPGSRTRNWLR